MNQTLKLHLLRKFKKLTTYFATGVFLGSIYFIINIFKLIFLCFYSFNASLCNKNKFIATVAS